MNVLTRNASSENRLDSGVTTRAVSIVGTLEYLAPEVIIMFGKRRLHKEGYTVSVDYWSLGVLIYKLLTGQDPYKKYSYDVLTSILPTHLAKYMAYQETFRISRRIEIRI